MIQAKQIRNHIVVDRKTELALQIVSIETFKKKNTET